jgi:hypothetical protein
MTLCLAKPKWIWFDEEEKNGGNFDDEILRRGKGKNEGNLMKEWKKDVTTPQCIWRPKPCRPKPPPTPKGKRQMSMN